MQEQRFSILLNKYVAKKLDADGINEFFELVDTGFYDYLINDFLLEELKAKRISDVHIPVHVSHEIMRKIAESDKFSKSSIQVSFRRYKLLPYLAAASVIFIIAISFFFFQNKYSKPAFASIIPTTNIVNKINNTPNPIDYYLPDSSVVTLQTGSSIHYTYDYENLKREVYLEGTACFDVTKNKNMPFYVYCGTVITKVLGTKFIVKGQNITNIAVEVKSGKVQVYENKKMLVDSNRVIQPVLLFPNQKVAYQEDVKQLNVTLVDTPTLVVKHDNYISESDVPVGFVFEKTKLGDIVKQLQQHYAIDIVLENDALNNCVFTGDVTEQDLYSKLKIICLTIDAGFQIDGTKILITGVGCK
jgi:hypothetical protein